MNIGISGMIVLTVARVGTCPESFEPLTYTALVQFILQRTDVRCSIRCVINNPFRLDWIIGVIYLCANLYIENICVGNISIFPTIRSIALTVEKTLILSCICARSMIGTASYSLPTIRLLIVLSRGPIADFIRILSGKRTDELTGICS